jgi:[ribosomal protein S5]-alanine N-acetyltransferase
MIAAPHPPLADAVVSLRPLAAGDAGAVDEALADPEITRWLDDRGFSSDALLARAAMRWEQSEGADFAIVDGGACVGSIWLDLGAAGRATVGYWLLPRGRGKGLVTHAAALVAGWAFSDLGVKRLGLLADPRNMSSIAVAERAGFRREGVLRSWADVNGERVDHVSFSLLPEELEGGSRA